VVRAPQNPVWNELSAEEQAKIAQARDRLAAVKEGEDLDAIREAAVALDEATRHFAELMMDRAVSSAIRGKTMNAAGEEIEEAVTAPHAFSPAEFK